MLTRVDVIEQKRIFQNISFQDSECLFVCGEMALVG